jgi:cytochrome c oxidase subunit IV
MRMKYMASRVAVAVRAVRSQAWLRWSAGAVICAVGLVSHLGWHLVWDHAAILIFLPLPFFLVMWLVVGAEDARRKLQAGPTCRRG